jgi:hypothetical protein
MATNDLSLAYNLLDIAKTHDNKLELAVATLLHKKNGVLRFSAWEQANQLTSHIFSKEVGLPVGTERAIGEGTTGEKAQNGQGVESLSYIESRSEIDIIMQRIKGAGFPAWRYARDMQHSEGLGQSMVNKLFYGTGLPGKIRGLTTRYNVLASYPNLKSAGGAVASANTSLWVMQPGEGKFTLLYGEAAKPGSPDSYSGGFINMQDMDVEFVVTNVSTGAGLHKYITLFDAFMGLCVYDDRAVQRLCNINTTTGAGEVDPDQVIWMIESLPDPEGEKVIYVNRVGKYQLKKNVTNKTLWSVEPDKYGVMRDAFYGVPIVLTESITNVEAVVS